MKIASGLDALHTHSLVYSALDPSHILLSESNSPVLSNFGFTRYIYPPKYFTGYQAPELVLSKTETDPTPSSDIWSFGCLIYYLFREHHLFENITQLQEFIEGRYIPDLPNNIPGYWKKIFWNCLCYQPNQRITIKEIIDILDSPPKDTCMDQYLYNKPPNKLTKIDFRNMLISTLDMSNFSKELFHFNFISEIYIDHIVINNDNIALLCEQLKNIPISILSFTCIYYLYIYLYIYRHFYFSYWIQNHSF